jgi:GntR family transcriptional regulator/MocR family aminotransferase
MFPYKTSFRLDRKSNQALYIQLSNQIIELIKANKLPPKTKLLGTRTLSELLGIHRKTVVACYEELMLQGWIETIAKKGTFVHRSLPELEHQDYGVLLKSKSKVTAGFSFYHNDILKHPQKSSIQNMMSINDGVSDSRLTPLDEIARTYRRIANKKSAIQHLAYGATFGNELLRETLVEYLNKTRGLNITKDNILITRGSQMGIYLASQLLLKTADVIVVGETNYSSASTTFLYHNAALKFVTVDNQGLDTKAIERLCKKQQIKAVYVTSHHHHPTTVTLSAERRIHLLNLAKTYNFAIIEDDYDYDFNYNHSPILPLASHDTNGNVIYIGSICKTVAPVFRIGYLIAPKEFVQEASNLRRYVDRQGDALLELTFADFIKNGDLDRHIKKVVRVYKARRDLFCKILKEELGEFFQFEIPKGGMAVWVQLNKKYTWKRVAQIALQYELEIPNWQRYDMNNIGHNSIRIGFASNNEEELSLLIEKLKSVCLVLKN